MVLTQGPKLSTGTERTIRPTLATGQSPRDGRISLSSLFWLSSRTASLYARLRYPLANVFCRNMAPTMCAPGITAIEADLHISSSVASTLAVTLYILGIAIGPMFMSPLSELYGRAPVYHVSNMMFVGFIVGSALSQNLAQFLVFRFFSGCAGGTPIALGGGTIADITTIQKRAVAMALFSMGPLAGPVSRSLSLALSRPYSVQASAWLMKPFRFSAQSSEASLPQDWVGAGRSGCYLFWEGSPERRRWLSCGRRTLKSFWSAKQPIYVLLLAT